MTRKDYVLIAGAFKTLLDQYAVDDAMGLGCGPAYARGIRAAAFAVAARLEIDNPRFDGLRFLKAAGAHA